MSHHGCEKYLNLLCSGKGKMDLQVKKLKVEISATTRQNSLPGPCHRPKAETNWSFCPVKGEDYENLFQNVYLYVNFLKHVTEECTFS